MKILQNQDRIRSGRQVVRQESAKLLHGGSIPPQTFWLHFCNLSPDGGIGIRARLKIVSLWDVGSTPTPGTTIKLSEILPTDSDNFSSFSDYAQGKSGLTRLNIWVFL